MFESHLEWNVSSGIVCNNLSDLPNITISVLALVRTETPVGHHGRKTRESGVLSRDFLGSGTSKEIEVENTTERVVLEILAF